MKKAFTAILALTLFAPIAFAKENSLQKDLNKAQDKIEKNAGLVNNQKELDEKTSKAVEASKKLMASVEKAQVAKGKYGAPYIPNQKVADFLKDFKSINPANYKKAVTWFNECFEKDKTFTILDASKYTTFDFEVDEDDSVEYKIVQYAFKVEGKNKKSTVTYVGEMRETQPLRTGIFR
ncbi:hypothetical protein Dip510_000361 [Elusimicrobium posterum]|uniref:hypothetical protein n=1 Tax=Elusimicrobium posterum TaxID=3116653 RepID=UPI003C778D85